MTKEEKAKAYDEALKRAEAAIDIAADKDLVKGVATTIFPELRESEDERIRKVLVDMVNRETGFTGFPSQGQVLAYLEKQKERGEANFREGYLHGFEDAQKEQKPTNNSTREKIISRATSEKQVVLISESSGEAEIGWDTRSLEDAKKLLEYGLAFINKSITNPAEKQKDSASNSFDDVWDEEDCEEIIAEGQKLTPRFKELLKEVCHAWYDRGVKLAEQKAAETPQWMIDFLNDILSSCIIYDDYVRRREYQSKVLGIIKWLENQKTKTPQWMIDFLKEIQPYSINKEEYAGYAGRIEFESKILTIIKWLESFRPRPHWKPSEEQMTALKCAIEDIAKFSKRGGRQVEFENEPYYMVLHSLYEQLKKLM